MKGLGSLLHGTYPGISNLQPRPPWNSIEGTNLTTFNETVDELNHRYLARFSGVTHTFVGYATVVYGTNDRTGHHSGDDDAG